jgi:ribosomal protein RSM22 (predicted rRNA methylase)
VTWEVPRELEDAVRAAVREQLGAEALATGPLVRAIVERSRRYTSERERLSAAPTGDLAARAAFFTIADAMKVALPLGELAARDALPARRPLRVVDVGAGCGTMTLGLVVCVDGALEVPAIERDAAALRLAARSIAVFGGARVKLQTVTGDVSSALPPADLVLLGSVLNELPAEQALRVVERGLAALAGDGALIVIEPALRDTSRALHAIRDQVIARGGHVFAPCTRRTAPCPMLASPDDWCHEDRPLKLPPATAELARLTHLRDDGMKLSYLTLRKAPLDLAADPGAWRVVAAPHAQKGKLELLGCGASGHRTLRLLKRHRAPGNRELERADRGDVLILTGAADDGTRLELSTTTTVDRPRSPPEHIRARGRP